MSAVGRPLEQLTIGEFAGLWEDAPPRGHGSFEHYGPWPSPSGYYSHFVVWKAVLAWTLDDWIRARRGQA